MQFRAQARRWTARAAGGAVALAAASAVSGVAATARAQGFGLNEIGSCAIGRGFAVTGAPCEDASVLYWNPGAAAVQPRGLSVYAGASAVQVKGSFTRDYTRVVDEGDVPVEFPPFLGVNWKGAGRLSLGVAAFVPYGLTSQWRNDFPGRFSAQRASLQSVYVQPTVAIELVPGRLSIGGGPTFGHSTLELRQSIDFSSQVVPNPLLPAGTTFAALGIAPGTEFATARVKGSANGTGFNVGALAKLTPSFSVGARYLSKVRFKYDEAKATFAPSPRADSVIFRQGNPLGAPVGSTLTQLVAQRFQSGQLLGPGQTANTQIDHPAQFQVGIGFTGLPNTTLSADYALIQWSAFQELPVDFGAASPLTRTLIEDYKNSNSYRVGLEHRFGGGIAGRAGFSYATTPAPDETVTALLPDMNRYNFNVGAGIPLGSRVALDAGYLRVETEGRRGRTGERASLSQTADQLNNGYYALNANIFSLSLKARF